MATQDWGKPQAMAIPKEGYFELEAGEIRPGLSADARVLRLHDHRQGQARTRAGHPRIRQEDRRIRRRRTRSFLAPLKLHYLRWVLFDVGDEQLFMYQGIFDTDFDNYPDDAIASFKDRHHDGVRESRGLPRGLENERARVREILSRPSAAELPGVRRVSLRHGG